MDKTLDKRRDLLVCVSLIVATLAVYWPVRNHDFVHYDDNLYVTENYHVHAGLTKEGIIWAFTTTHAGNWHPLTWLSHMLDCQMYGLSPGWHHLTSLLFHIANTLLLFVVFKRMTGALWQSAFVAALFGLHPLHVESVAWAAERKDVLSTFFWMLTMGSYVRYVERPGVRRYLLALLFFALGLMSKPMLVTLPFVLLLLDYWPLERFQLGYDEPQPKNRMNPSKKSLLLLHLIREKAPFFVLAAVSCIMTFLAQQSGGAVASLDRLAIDIRIANALVSYVSYIGKMIWPIHLAVFYPHPGMLPIWRATGAGLLLVCISVLMIRTARRFPYLAAGWLWYVGTLVPVIGLVQVGSQALADRYTYVPLIGLFIIIAWGVADLATRWPYQRLLLATSTGIILLVFTVCTWLQVNHWCNSIALFRHTLDVTGKNCLAYNYLGTALADQGRLEEAINHYYKALQINPNYAAAHNNLGGALHQQGKLDGAISHFSKALKIKPDYAMAHYNLGNALSKQGRTDEAIRHYNEALRINPDYAMAHINLGNALSKQGRMDEAIGHYNAALRVDPDFAIAYFNWGNVLSKQGRTDEAIRHYNEALRINPDYAMAHNNLGDVLSKQGRTDEAIRHYYEMLRINPDDAIAHYNLGNALFQQDRTDEAVRHYNEALRINPDYAMAHCNLGSALHKQGKLDEAISHYSMAVRIDPDCPIARHNLSLALRQVGKHKEGPNTFTGP